MKLPNAHPSDVSCVKIDGVVQRFRDIATFVLQHTTFPTSPQSPQNFSMFPWE